MFVTSANSAYYFDSLGFSTVPLFQTERAKQVRSYIEEYGGFFMPKKLEELRRTAEIVNSNNCERYAVVLAGEISNVSANGAMFGVSREHPFRGVFDGNGYQIHVNSLYISQRVNGLFGYIAEEGIIRNLTLTQKVDNNGTFPVEVNSNQYVSLDTIKQGLGDVSFGLLAGVNNGFCENVAVSADLKFNGRLRPNVYFTHNKTVDDESIASLYSDAWRTSEFVQCHSCVITTKLY